MKIDSDAAAIALLKSTEPVTPEQFAAFRTWIMTNAGLSAFDFMRDNEPAMVAFRARNQAMIDEFYANN